MAFTLTLTDGTDTVSLNDGVNYFTDEEGMDTPPPEPKPVWGGDNAFRDGADLIGLRYQNRTVRIRFSKLKGASEDNLITALQSVQKLLRKAQDAQIWGFGAEVELQYKWTNATSTVYFDVLTGELKLPPNYLSIFLTNHKTIMGAELILTCRPFAAGALSATHENYVDNPSFEHGSVAPGDSWLTYGASLAWVTTAGYVKYGSRGLEISVDVNNDRGIRSDAFTVPSAASTGYIQAWGRHGGGDRFRLMLYDETVGDWLTITYDDGASGYWTSTDNTALVRRGGTFSKPNATTSLRVYVLRLAADATQGSVLNLDGVYLNPVQSTAPIFWISSRNLINHIDSTADHINYFDIEGVPGDMPAGLRVAGLTGNIAQRYRATPYNYVQNLEAEDGTLGAGMAIQANAAYSNGNCVQSPTAEQLAWTTVVTWTINSNMVHRYGRIRIIAGVAVGGANAVTVGLRGRLSWGSTPTTYTGPNTSQAMGGIVDQRRWVDLGVFEIPPGAYVPRDGEVDTLDIIVQYTKTTASNVVRLDNIYLMPIAEGYVSLNGPNVADSTVEPPFVGKLSTVSDDTSDWSMDVTSFTGAPLLVQPNQQNRFYWRAYTLSSGVELGDITTTGQVRAKIRPRYFLVK